MNNINDALNVISYFMQTSAIFCPPVESGYWVKDADGKWRGRGDLDGSCYWEHRGVWHWIAHHDDRVRRARTKDLAAMAIERSLGMIE